MKRLHVVATDGGGASRAMIRISNSINNYSTEYSSKVLVLSKANKDNSIYEIKSNKKQK